MNADPELIERPSTMDEYVRRRAAEIILPEILAWMGNRDASPFEQEEITRQLMKVVTEHGDGFEMAKRLERSCGWNACSSLVEILDGCWVSDALDELTWQWVRCLNIRPEMSIGDRVFADVFSRREEVGTVARVDEKAAKYGVHYSDQVDGSYYLVPFEKCRPALTCAEAVAS